MSKSNCGLVLKFSLLLLVVLLAEKSLALVGEIVCDPCHLVILAGEICEKIPLTKYHRGKPTEEN